MYPNIQRAMSRNMKKTQKICAIIIPLCFLYLFWWNWYSSGGISSHLSYLFLAIGLLMLVSIPLNRWSQKKIGKKQMGQFTEAQLKRIDLFCETAQPIRDITVTPDALIGPGVMVPVDRLVWIFIRSRTQQMAATIQEIIAVTADKEEHSIYLGTRPGPFRQADQEAVQEITRRLLTYRPGLFVGHSEENQKLYRENFTAMAAAAEQKTRQAQQR